MYLQCNYKTVETELKESKSRMEVHCLLSKCLHQLLDSREHRMVTPGGLTHIIKNEEAKYFIYVNLILILQSCLGKSKYLLPLNSVPLHGKAIKRKQTTTNQKIQPTKKPQSQKQDL